MNIKIMTKIVAIRVTSLLNRLYPYEIAVLPNPPAPIAPAIAVKPIRLITVTVETRAQVPIWLHLNKR